MTQLKNNTPRLMIVSAMSGGGKTTFTSALLRILRDRGHKTAPFKCGPDYIDPMFQRAACGETGTNLDLFFCDEEQLKTVFSENAQDADMAVIEGVMGCYDGLSMDSSQASSYDIAARLGCPVVLILPARGMAYTAAAIIKGILSEDRHGLIKAVVLNNVSKMTYERLKPVIEWETGIRAAGYIPKLADTIESRHLGLVTPTDETERVIAGAAAVISETVDIDLLLDIAADCEEISCSETDIAPAAEVNVAVAYDDAFCFYYKDNLDILKRAGARLTYFSPIKDKRLPEDIGAILLGGGYPELYARELGANKSMLGDIKRKISSGMPCLAECGGFMYLHSVMEGADGKEYKMADVIKGKAFRTGRLVRFGYIGLEGDNRLLYPGEAVKAHEFHYWDSTANGSGCLAIKPGGRRSWECMHITDTLAAGFPHLYYRSNVEFIKRFLHTAAKKGACKNV